MTSIFIPLGGIFGAFGVALGAFGAHALKERVSGERLKTFETGVHYQLWHSLALVLIGFGANWLQTDLWLIISGWLFIAGIIFFSGSLYLLVFTNQTKWGAIAPIGGTAFILGWFSLALSGML